MPTKTCRSTGIKARLTRLLACSLLAGLSFSAQALPQDRNEPIHISADQARMDDAQGRTEYQGGVIITQGTLKITADKVELLRNSGEVKRMIATGNSHYQQVPEPGQPLTHAYGERMVYQVDTQELTITGNARVNQAQDTFTGNKIVYLINQGKVNAFGSPSGDNGRVQMIIQPKDSAQ